MESIYQEEIVLCQFHIDAFYIILATAPHKPLITNVNAHLRVNDAALIIMKWYVRWVIPDHILSKWTVAYVSYI